MSSSDEPLTVPALVAAAAQRWPDGLWLNFEGTKITFKQLAERVDATARTLHGYGVRPGNRVGLFMGNRPEWLEIQYAVASLGAWLVPLNTMLTVHELTNLIRHSQLDTLIWADRVVDHDMSGRLGELLDNGVRPERVLVVGDAGWPEGTDTWETVAARAAQAGPDAASGAADVKPDDVAMIIYTSGTTGAPKGVLQTHRSLAVSMRRFAGRLGLGPGDRSIFASPLFWIHGCWHQSVIPLVAGSAIVLEQRFEAARVLRRLTEAGVTHLQGVPLQYEQLLAHPDSEQYDLSGLRIVQIGGSTFSPTLPERIKKRAPAAEFIAAYGLSEAGQTCYTPPGASLEDIATTIGQVHAGGQARIIAPEDPSATLEPGQPGELLLRSDCVMVGYLDAPEATSAALAGDWLHTGDLAFMDDRQYITILGRNQDAYKRGGVTVYTIEAEGVLNEHPGVDLATVVGIADEKFGQVGMAFVIRADPALTEDALLEYLGERLARYKVPARVRFVSEVPMTPSGKVKKYELRKAAS